MSDQDRVSLYSELLFGAYALIAVVCGSYYMDITPPENDFAKCDIIHEGRIGKEKCGMYNEHGLYLLSER